MNEMKNLPAILWILILIMGYSKAWPMYDGRYYENGLLLPADRLPPQPPNRDNITVAFYAQKLDHFNKSDGRTFKQKYMVNGLYYNPINETTTAFLYLGGEGPLSRKNIDTNNDIRIMDWMKNAKIYGAMAFALEHRYYGESLPFGQMTTANLKFLSSKQAIEDIVQFIKYATRKYNLVSVRWIVFGGSYAGNLAAWVRDLHSDTVLGSIASSAPLKAKLDFYEYLNVVGDDLKRVNQSCFDLTKAIFDSVASDLTTIIGKLKLIYQVGVCPPIRVKSADSRGLFYDTLMSPFMSIAQYGGNNLIPFIWLDMESLCATIEDTSGFPDPLDRLVNVLKLMVSGKNETAEEECFDVDYGDFLDKLRTDIGYKPWAYQKCTEFGYFKTTNGKNHPFGERISIDFREDPCQSIFGITKAQVEASVKETNEYYGGRNKFNSSNVVLVNGSQDPWHSLGISHVKANRPLYDIAFIEGTAHAADMQPASENDPPQLVGARELITEKIGQWLKEIKN